MAKNKQNMTEVGREWEAEDTDFFNFGMEDVAIPNLVIVQPTSSNIPDGRKHIGELYNTVTGEFYEKVEVFFVGGNTPRAVLPFPYSSSAPQLCASPDGIAPFPRFVNTQIEASSDYDEQTVDIPETCAECPLVESPLCTVMYRYYGVLVDQQYPFSMRLKKSAKEAGKRLNFLINQLQMRRLFRTFWITTEEKVSASGTFFIPKFDPGREANQFAEQAKELHAMLQDRIRSRAQLESGEYNGE